MAEERVSIDISTEPALIRLVEKVRASNATFVLQVDREDVAILTPSPKAKTRGGQPLTGSDALFRLAGIGSSGIPGGVSGRKHETLRRAKRSG